MMHAVTFHLADLNRTAIMQSPIERVLEKLGDKIDKAARELEKMHQTAAALTNAVDGTGLRLSQRTLRMLKDMPQQFDPREFDPDGYVILADIPKKDAQALYRIFRDRNADRAKQHYAKIAPEIRERFGKHFKVSFD